MKNVTITIDDETHRAARIRAAEMGTSLSALVKDYLPATLGQAPGLQGLVYGVVLVAVVLFEPMGLYGRWLKVRTYLQLFPFYRKGMFKRQKSFQKSDRLR